MQDRICAGCHRFFTHSPSGTQTIVIGKWGGLVPATFAMILVAALGDRKNSVRSAFFLALGVTAAAVAIFHYGLQLQFPLFTWG